jgi:hypothetical protein
VTNYRVSFGVACLVVVGCGSGSASDPVSDPGLDPGTPTPPPANDALGVVMQRADIVTTARLTITANPPAQNDKFGAWAALDDDTAVVSTNSDATAWVYTRAGTTWSAGCKLATKFGWPSVKRVNGHATIAGRGFPSGNVVIYRNNGTACTDWVKEFDAPPPSSPAFGQPNISVDIDGDHVVTANGPSVVDYRRATSGVWTPASIPSPSGATIQVVAVNATMGIAASDPAQGKVYFRLTGGSTWSQVYPANNGAGIQGIGGALALDSSRLFIGSPIVAPNNETVSIGTLNGSTWSQFVSLTPPQGASVHEGFGTSLAVQGNRLVVGAPLSVVNGLNIAGRAYSYRYNGPTSSWVPVHEFHDPAPAVSDYFGYGVGVTGRSAWVGVMRLRPNASPSPAGSVYEFSLDANNRYEPTTRTPHFGLGTATDLVAVSRLSPGANNGVADVFTGQAAGNALVQQQVLVDNLPAAGPYIYSESLSWGLVNNDGFADLVAGGLNRTANGQAFAGGFSLYPGSAIGLNSAFRTVIDRSNEGDNSPLTDPKTNDYFGCGTAVGDFDDDGFDDIAVGARGDSALVGGSVQYFVGGPSGLGTNNGRVIGGGTASDLFGSYLAAGDFNCDGYEDLAASALGKNGDSGVVYIYNGSATGLFPLPMPSQTFDETSFGDIANPHDEFGRELAVGNFNGDMKNGIPCVDLAIGAAQRDAPGAGDSGGVYVLYGGPAGSPGAKVKIRQSDIPGEDVVAGELFGVNLSALPNGTLTDDLVVGAAGEDGVGAVYLFKGGPAGLNVTVPTKWTQDTANVPETSVADDLWGFAVAGLGNGAVAIGAPHKDVGAVTGTGGVTVLRYTSSGSAFSVVSGVTYHQAGFTTAPAPLNQDAANRELGLELLKPRGGR